MFTFDYCKLEQECHTTRGSLKYMRLTPCTVGIIHAAYPVCVVTGVYIYIYVNGFLPCSGVPSIGPQKPRFLHLSVRSAPSCTTLNSSRGARRRWSPLASRLPMSALTVPTYTPLWGRPLARTWLSRTCSISIRAETPTPHFQYRTAKTRSTISLRRGPSNTAIEKDGSTPCPAR